MSGGVVAHRKPFHKSAVDKIRQTLFFHDLEVFGKFLMITIIPKGHDDIVKAWDTQCLALGIDKSTAKLVREDILRQKQEVETVMKTKEEVALEPSSPLLYSD